MEKRLVLPIQRHTIRYKKLSENKSGHLIDHYFETYHKQGI